MFFPPSRAWRKKAKDIKLPCNTVDSVHSFVLRWEREWKHVFFFLRTRKRHYISAGWVQDYQKCFSRGIAPQRLVIWIMCFMPNKSSWIKRRSTHIKWMFECMERFVFVRDSIWFWCSDGHWDGRSEYKRLSSVRKAISDSQIFNYLVPSSQWMNMCKLKSSAAFDDQKSTLIVPD